MRKIFIIAAMAVCAAACSSGRNSDLYKDAVKEEIIRLVGADAKVSFNSFELHEATTFSDELDYRKNLITARKSMNDKFSKRYAEQSMRTNALKKLDALMKDEDVLKGIDGIRERMASADSLDKVAYYVYKFTGEARCEGVTTMFKDYFACVTPAGEVLSVTDQEKAIHKGLGKVIGGYNALLKAGREE